MSVKLQPPPFKAMLEASNGFANEPWEKWIRQLFQLLSELQTENESLKTQVAALNAEVHTLSGGAWP